MARYVCVSKALKLLSYLMFNYFLLQYYNECGCFWTKTFNISYMTKCIRQLAEWEGIFGSYIFILILFPKTFPTVMSKYIRLVHHWTSVLIFLYTVLFSLHIIHSVNRTNIKHMRMCVFRSLYQTEYVYTSNTHYICIQHWTHIPITNCV